MKRTCKVLAATLCFALLFSTVLLLPTSLLAEEAVPTAENADIPEPTGPLTPAEPAEPAYAGEYYDYPITPEKDWDAWVKAANIENLGHGGSVNVCRIPEETLKILTTEQLLKSAIHHPLAGEIVCFDTLEQGLRFQIGDFNDGLTEFLKREDCSEVLAKYYTSLTEEDVRYKENDHDANMRVWFLETVVCVAAKDGLLTPMDSAIIDSHHEKLKDEFACSGFLSEVVTAARNTLQEKAGEFLQGGGVISDGSAADSQYDGKDDSSYIAIKKTVKTLAGSSLQVLDFTDSLTTADYNTFLAEAQNFKARYPDDVVILANPLLKYNCHANAWHKYFSDCQKIWMDYPEAQVYMTDGSFLQKGYLAPSDSYPAGAEIISYQTPSVADLDHSARVYRASQKIVQSK